MTKGLKTNVITAAAGTTQCLLVCGMFSGSLFLCLGMTLRVECFLFVLILIESGDV